MKLFQYLTQIQLLILGYVLSLSHCTDMLQFLSKENVHPIMLGLRMKLQGKNASHIFRYLVKVRAKTWWYESFRSDPEEIFKYFLTFS